MPGFIGEDQVRLVKSRIDLVQLMSEYTPLRKSGSNFTGWSNAGTCTTSLTCTFTLSTGTTVTATFGTAPQSTYAQTVTADAPAGAVSVASWA